MRYGAVIVAAGMSTRMHQFKQLMKVGDISFAERVVNNFAHAGVEDIIMVTGFQAGKVEKALSKLPVTFVRNEDYETTQMFESAKLGLKELQGKVDKVFFCPVDVPFFLEETVRLEMTRDEDLIYPICHNRIGHPVLFSASYIPKILMYDGPRGLKGALDSLYSQKTCFLPVRDEGVSMDADTKEDYQYLLDIQNSSLLHVQTSISLATTKAFLGEEMRDLLSRISEEHSVRRASEEMGISYSKAWNMIHNAEEQLGYPVVERKAGGKYGGSAEITERGEYIIKLYDSLRKHVKDAADQEFCNLFSASVMFPDSSREGSKR